MLPIRVVGQMLSFSVIAAIAIWLSVAYSHPRPAQPIIGEPDGSWNTNLDDFSTLVTFGDSYTDESRGLYFSDHGGEKPPAGWEGEITNDTACGGYVWPRYVNWYRRVRLYNYAVGGAVCSRNIVKFNGLVNSIEEYQISAYEDDMKHKNPNGSPFLEVSPEVTIYAIWIGTNDIGVQGFLTDSQIDNKAATDYIDCVFNALNKVFEAGGRRFVLMNLAPLNYAPIYALPDKGGTEKDKFWPNKPENLTQISMRMQQQVALINRAYETQTPFEVKVAKRYPGSEFAVFDVFSLISDIYDNGDHYLNGTAAANTTGRVRVCNTDGKDCENYDNPDSFLWYDELHPSEQASRLIAQEFVKVVAGKSKYAKYWS